MTRITLTASIIARGISANPRMTGTQAKKPRQA